MPTVGEQLRLAREAQGLTVHQVAETTKIKTDHVRALEGCNYGVFAAPVYVRGFVRSIGKLLKLDTASLMEGLDEELRSNPQLETAPTLSPRSQTFLDEVLLQLSKVRWRVAAPSILVGFALIVAVFGFRWWRNRELADPLSNFEPGLYQPAVPAGETLPLPGSKK